MKFDEEVWELVKKIPRGRVVTYGEIAMKLRGSKRYARAVGQALARNPHPVVVPCHRVVRSSGEIGGYSRGVEEKERLLREEGVEISAGKVKHLEKFLFRFDEEYLTKNE